MFALLLLSIPSCQQPAAPAPLVVEGGYASAIEAAPGAEIHVWAHVPIATHVFLGWEGPAVQQLSDPLCWHTLLTVPEDGLPHAAPQLRARIAPAAAELQTLTFTGPARAKELDWAVPSGELRGLVFFFHESDARRGFIRKPEAWHLALTLLHHGFAVASLTSEETDAQDPGEDKMLRWNGREMEVEKNLDMQNVQAARAALIAAGAVREDTPCFGVGNGNGGTFAVSAAEALGWRAAASICGPGRKDLLATSTVPVFWSLYAKDTTIKGIVDNAREARDLLAERGIPVDLALHQPSPFRPERLVDRCGMDSRFAEDLIAIMRRVGMMDEAGALLLPANYVTGRMEAEKNNFEDLHIWIAEDMTRFQDLTVQVRVCTTEHVMSGDDALRLTRFFAARLAE
jgi:hypothetical protein